MILSLQQLMNQLIFLSVLLVFWVPPLQGAEGRDVQERYTEVAMRMIGHEVLNCLGDTDSRVLPIEKVDDRYYISFATELAFDPSDLVAVIADAMERAAVANNYLVEVADCDSQEVVYSFVVFLSDNGDILPCEGRMLPEACYQLLVTIMDDAAVEYAVPVALDTHAHERNGIMTSIHFAQIRFWVVLPLLLVLGVTVLLSTRKIQIVRPVDSMQIGAYRLDQRTLVLTIGDTKTQLSHKEAELLQVLHQSANTAVERAVLLEKIWGDEGSYVGRTLDVFISKLRKKLAADHTLQIVNIRGVGYKLVMAS
ncbi:MAG: winged helix-turn-helix domain-containing protein [Bacteroidota bacterium]